MAKSSSPTAKLLKILAGIVGVLLIVVIALRVTGVFGERDTSTSVEVEEASLRTITQVVTASGRVQPEVQVKISPDVSGEIIQLTVREGDQVDQGELLVRIRPDFYAAQAEQAQAGVSQARAALAQSRANLLNAELEVERQRSLAESGAVATTELERAETNYAVQQAAYEAAEFSVQSAQARFREAREQLALTTIYAPMSGTVSLLAVELGERVVGTTQMQGTEMMRVARLDQMEMEVDVNENDVVNVAVGDTARLEIDAYPERAFAGVVTEIANSARTQGAGTQEQVTNFPVKIRILDAHNIPGTLASTSAAGDGEGALPNPSSPTLRPGMSGTVDIFTQTIGDAVAVPIQAVTVRDFSDMRPLADSLVTLSDSDPEDLRRVVFVVRDGVADMVEVDTGISDDTHVQITSGLSAGETVVTGPFRLVSRTLEPGDRVRFDEDDEEENPDVAQGD
jgi:HlyD family secretion protein